MWRFLAILVLICPFLAHSDPIVPCYFIFGDSGSDAGNNNALNTAAKSNYLPYGVDFYGGASGRFTNNQTYVDLLTQRLGFEGYIPPSSNVEGPIILKGVNYASGAAGIRLETGSYLGDRLWLDRQLQNHAIIIAKLPLYVQGPVSDYLNKCLYTVDIGTDDYINNYFMPRYYATRRLFSTEQYATLLAAQYAGQLKVLYASGARKVAIFGLGRLGCLPGVMAMYNTTQCVEEVNQAVQPFNQKVMALVVQFNSQLPGAKFTFINTYAMQMAFPTAGLITNSTCCILRSDYQCEPYLPPCSNRSLYAFFDGYHPTQAVNEVKANISFSTADRNIAYPMNISLLASS